MLSVSDPRPHTLSSWPLLNSLLPLCREDDTCVWISGCERVYPGIFRILPEIPGPNSTPHRKNLLKSCRKWLIERLVCAGHIGVQLMCSLERDVPSCGHGPLKTCTSTWWELQNSVKLSLIPKISPGPVNTLQMLNFFFFFLLSAHVK